jgi:hypothetical protein
MNIMRIVNITLADFNIIQLDFRPHAFKHFRIRSARPYFLVQNIRIWYANQYQFIEIAIKISIANKCKHVIKVLYLFEIIFLKGTAIEPTNFHHGFLSSVD